MKTKNVLIVTGFLLTGIALVAYEKIKKMQAVFDRMSIQPSGLSNLKFGLKTISFKLGLKINNPTNQGFYVSGGSLVTLKKVDIYFKNQFLGTANVNVTSIAIPEHSSIEITGIPISMLTQNVLGNVIGNQNLDFNELTIIATLSVLGNEYIVEG
ncbi:hypothetical protein DVK85_01270 [Flavobacterium arcticum]|uniref:Uncharacterized protein n=1 Tax=Flavobacterium arcticum TaxID=1784713 RepID=A0A345H8M2_9FLAO|nr:hypothetical protein [Flavobacterium arcticum]AXG72932.1 hypothetical protein DVK85_01270 [Flavobacterium arcticum]KAF2510404.1 hypothetical protein E0W72_07935 [Flavobacterium arcticum]